MKTILNAVRYSRFFLRFFKSVILILLLVTVVFSWIFYRNFVLAQKDDIISDVYERLNNIEKVMNSNLEQFLKIVVHINGNTDFFYNGSTSMEQKNQMIEELERYTVSNSFIENISYYSLLDDNTVYSNLGIYTTDVFSKYIYATVDFNREDFVQRKKLLVMSTIPSYSIRKAISTSPKSPVVAFVYGLPIGTENQKRFITFYVDKNQIDNIIEQTFDELPIELYIYELDTLIYSAQDSYYQEDTDYREDIESEKILELAANSDRKPVKKDDYIYFSLSSRQNTWTYVLKCNKNTLFSEFYKTNIFYILLFCVILLFMLFTAGIIAFFNYKPVYNLISNIRKKSIILHEQPDYDEIAYINRLVETEINKKQRLLKNLFISNLIWGQYENTEAIFMAAQEANIVFEFKYFTCCTIFYCSNNENSGQKDEVLLSKVESDLDLPNTQVICTKLYKQPYISVVLNHFDDKLIEENLKSALEILIKDVEESCNYIVSVGISDTCTSVDDVSQIFVQSQQSVYYCILNNKRIANYKNIKIIESSNQFRDLKLNISNDINRGNQEAAMTKIDQFIDQWTAEYENIIKPEYICYRILDYIVNTLSLTFPNLESKIVKDYKQILSNPIKKEELYARIENLCRILCSLSSGANKKSNTELKDKILNFVEKNLLDNTLSLEIIANECNITTSYLVRFFKNETGYTPMQYVDMRRMEIAKNLLINSNLNLKQIVEQSGYIDESNFIRKFKKAENVTPMNYRKRYQERFDQP